MRALRRIGRAIELHSHALANRYGLTVPQLALLKQLAVRDGVPIGELTRHVHLSQATVTGILDRLQRRGLINRRRGEADKRKVYIHLTNPGREALRTAPPLLHEHFTAALGKLQDWEQTQILSVLQRVVSMMETRRFEAAAVDTAGGHGDEPASFAGLVSADTPGTSSASDPPPDDRTPEAPSRTERRETNL